MQQPYLTDGEQSNQKTDNFTNFAEIQSHDLFIHNKTKEMEWNYAHV